MKVDISLNEETETKEVEKVYLALSNNLVTTQGCN